MLTVKVKNPPFHGWYQTHVIKYGHVPSVLNGNDQTEKYKRLRMQVEDWLAVEYQVYRSYDLDGNAVWFRSNEPVKLDIVSHET